MPYYTNENSISAGFIFGKCKTQSHNKCIRTHRETGTRKKWKILYWWIIGHINWCRNSINLDFIDTVFHRFYRKNWMKLGRIPLTSEIYYFKNDIDGATERRRKTEIHFTELIGLTMLAFVWNCIFESSYHRNFTLSIIYYLWISFFWRIFNSKYSLSFNPMWTQDGNLPYIEMISKFRLNVHAFYWIENGSFFLNRFSFFQRVLCSSTFLEIFQFRSIPRMNCWE